jgi:hypothetical protein
MPAACMICGGPVATHVTKMFVTRPKWTSIFFFLSAFGCVVFFFLILAAGAGGIGMALGICACLPLLVGMIAFAVIGTISTRRMAVECPMCERHRGYWVWRGFWVYGTLMVLTIAAIVQAVLALTDSIRGSATAILFLCSCVLALVWAVGSIAIQHFSLKAVAITADDIILTPVHAAFLEQVRLGRSNTGTQRDLGWDEYDPYPRVPKR